MNLAISIRETHGVIRAGADPAIEIAPEILHHKAIVPFTAIAKAIEAAVPRRIGELFADRACRMIVVKGLRILQIGAAMMNRVRCGIRGWRWFCQGWAGEQNREAGAGNHGIETKNHRHSPPTTNPPATEALYQYDTIHRGRKGGKVGTESMVNYVPACRGKALAARPAIG